MVGKRGKVKRRGKRRGKRIGLVCEGGGFTAAFQVGCLRALSEAGIVPCYCQGVSAGALNLVKWIECDYQYHSLWMIWDEVEKGGADSVFPAAQLIRNFFRENKSENKYLARKIEEIDVHKVVSSPTLLDIVVRNLNEEKQELISNHFYKIKKNPHLLRQVILAAVALPGFMPAQTIFGTKYSDGFGFLIDSIVEQKCDLVLVVLTRPRNIKRCNTAALKPRWLPMGVWEQFQAFNYMYECTIRKSMAYLKEKIGDRLKIIMPSIFIPTIDTMRFKYGDIAKLRSHGYQRGLKALNIIKNRP